MRTKLFLLAVSLLAVVALSAQINFPLTREAQISVNVTGFVARPGTYQMSNLSRISDALQTASREIQQISTLQPVTPKQMREIERDSLLTNFQALRSVRLVRNGVSISYDYLKFMRKGDLNQNPLLKDDDIIIVGSIGNSFSIAGEVYFPGEYEFIEGDRLADLLDLAQGFTLTADTRSVNIYRYRENLVDFDVLTIDLSQTAPADVPMRNHDRVLVPQSSEFRRAWKITVEGNVKAPGEYYIGEETTLYDILTLCGGPTARGDLGAAVYANIAGTLKGDPEFERLKDMAYSDMTLMEYTYMLNRMRQFPGKYSVDILRTWASQGAEANPVLRDGDYLFVPELVDMVEVTGQVVNPGLVPWVAGKTWDYYIAQAGGFTNNKRWNGTRIISADSGNWVKPGKKVPINPGDKIFVPEKSGYDTWTRFKDIMLIATQVITVFLGVRTIMN
jgi:protein involved in polysaccharide export with SLBB domain